MRYYLLPHHKIAISRHPLYEGLWLLVSVVILYLVFRGETCENAGVVQ